MIINTLWGPEEMKSKECSVCGESRALSEYSKMIQNKDGLDTRCKVCEKLRYLMKKELLRTAPPKPEICDCCGKNPQDQQYPKPICLDHNHKTGSFRGWLCDDCNLGIGKLGDDLEGVMRAVRFLEKQELVL